jgi:RimK family alpha-L-glutamate ligase
MRFALVAGRPTPTNSSLACALLEGGWEEMSPREALAALRPGDVALGRLDVLPTLDGVEEGLWVLGALAARGVRVLNDRATLLATHDKLLTARLLRRHGLPHPRTSHVRDGRSSPQFTGPAVVKPRFGSWGSDVHRCDDIGRYHARLADVRASDWYGKHGALVQELVAPAGYDLRIIVVAGRVVGAIYRVAPEGEWRTNVALGATREIVEIVPPDAAALAVEAARVAGGSLIGVDLLPDESGGWIVLELNGAVEFTHEYAPSYDIYVEVGLALQREAFECELDDGYARHGTSSAAA